MDKESYRKAGARSRSRGRNFENDVAKALGWSRVAFSGANAAYGEGDVIDGFVNGAGYWLAECKRRQGKEHGNVTIEGKWIEQAEKACERSGRWPIIIVGTKTDHRKPQGLVFLDGDSVGFMLDRVQHGLEDIPTWLYHSNTQWWETRSTSQTGGFTVRAKYLNSEWRFAVILVEHGLHINRWAIMRLDDFAWLNRNVSDFCVPGPNFYDKES